MTKTRKQTLKILSLIGAITLLLSSMLVFNVTADGSATPPAQTNLLTETTNFTAYKIAYDQKIWDDTYNYGAISSYFYDSSKPFYPKNLCDGDTTTLAHNNQAYANVWAAPFGADRRIAFWMDLGDLYDLSEINLYASAANVCFYDFTVYASDTVSAAATLLADTYEYAHYTSATANAKSSLAIESDKKVRYVLIVFNKSGADPGNSSVPSTDAAYAAAGTYGNNPLPGITTPRGGINITEIEIFADENQSPNILAGNTNVRLAQIAHDLDWGDTEADYDYKAEDLEIQTGEYIATAAPVWTDGKFDAEGAHNPGRNAAVHTKKRYAFVYDLGGYYTLNEVAVYQLAKTCKDQALGGDGRMIYGMSVYAGVVDDGSILNNRIAYYESDATDQTSIKMAVTSEKVVRYVMIVWNLLGSDPGNTRDGLGSPVGTITADSLTGCSWANGGIWLSEIEVRGEEAEDPTDTKQFTDAETGIKVDMITYDNNVKVESMVVTKKELTPAQKTVIEEDEGLYAVNGLYNIVFKDAQGNPVTDMSGRKFTISVAMELGDESVYVLDAAAVPVYLPTVFDLDNNLLTYTCENGEYYFDYIVATTTAPEEDDTNNDNTNNDNTNNDDTTNDDSASTDDNASDNNSSDNEGGVDLPATGEQSVFFFVAALLIGAAFVTMKVASPAKN